MTETPWAGMLAVLAASLLVAGLLAAVHRWVPYERRQPSHDVVSAIFAMVGVLYAVLLAFVVIVVWEFSSAATDSARVEANELSQIYFTAGGLPEPQRSEMKTLARRYAETVVNEEWALMARGDVSPHARELVARMRVSVQSLEPVGARDEILMTNSLASINALVEARRERTGAIEQPVPLIMWIGLGIGTVVTVGFTFFYGLERLAPHLTMVVSMTALLVFMLWLVYEMGSPYSGPTGTGPDAFAQVLARFREFS